VGGGAARFPLNLRPLFLGVPWGGFRPQLGGIGVWGCDPPPYFCLTAWDGENGDPFVIARGGAQGVANIFISESPPPLLSKGMKPLPPSWAPSPRKALCIPLSFVDHLDTSGFLNFW